MVRKHVAWKEIQADKGKISGREDIQEVGSLTISVDLLQQHPNKIGDSFQDRQLLISYYIYCLF